MRVTRHSSWVSRASWCVRPTHLRCAETGCTFPPPDKYRINGVRPMSSAARVALVTGAGSGIGRRTALAFSEAGYAVVLAGRRREALAATAAEARNLGSPPIVIPTDLSKPASVKALFAKTKKTFGRLDVLFNNAGVFGTAALLEDLTPRQWQDVVDINLTAALLCTQRDFP